MTRLTRRAQRQELAVGMTSLTERLEALEARFDQARVEHRIIDIEAAQRAADDRVRTIDLRATMATMEATGTNSRLVAAAARLHELEAETAIVAESSRGVSERIGRAEVTLHTHGTYVANHSAVMVALESRLRGIEQRLDRADDGGLAALEKRIAELSSFIESSHADAATTSASLSKRLSELATRLTAAQQMVHERTAAAEQGLAGLRARLDQAERALQNTAAATDVVEARMTMIRVAGEVARLDIELRAELARAVNHVSAMVGLPEPTFKNEDKAPAPPAKAIDVRQPAEAPRTSSPTR